MPPPPSAPRKRRTRQHVIADLGVNFVERQALMRGHSVERWLHDYGMDMVLWMFDDRGEVEPGLVFVQVKATDRPALATSGGFVSCRIHRADLRAWLDQPMPVILALYDAVGDRAWWLYVQAVFGGVNRFRSVGGSATLTARIPTANVLDVAAIDRFRWFRDSVKQQSEGVVHHE